MCRTHTVEAPRSDDLDTLRFDVLKRLRDIIIVDQRTEPVHIRAKECKLPL